MIVAPAVDLKGGRCVQLVGGRPEDERVSLPDPVSVARGWADRGFGTLHLVDLDAALGSGSNRDLLLQAAEATPSVTQAGGGIRDDESAATLLDGGLDRIIVGTRAITDRPWLSRLVRSWPNRVMVAADLKDGRIVRKGWTEETPLRADAFLRSLDGLPLAGVLCTDVGREGRLEGIDVDSVRTLIEASPTPVWISGGVTTMQDLEFLASEGAAGAVLGMAIYTGAVDTDAVAKEYGS
jgi:phosphoribosylformimino-5-aminoimidazole carboxamide ribotide isomerase